MKLSELQQILSRILSEDGDMDVKIDAVYERDLEIDDIYATIHSLSGEKTCWLDLTCKGA